jgi:hypothetical protein
VNRVDSKIREGCSSAIPALKNHSGISFSLADALRKALILGGPPITQALTLAYTKQQRERRPIQIPFQQQNVRIAALSKGNG